MKISKSSEHPNFQEQIKRQVQIKRLHEGIIAYDPSSQERQAVKRALCQLEYSIQSKFMASTVNRTYQFPKNEVSTDNEEGEDENFRQQQGRFLQKQIVDLHNGNNKEYIKLSKANECGNEQKEYKKRTISSAKDKQNKTQLYLPSSNKRMNKKAKSNTNQLAQTHIFKCNALQSYCCANNLEDKIEQNEEARSHYTSQNLQRIQQLFNNNEHQYTEQESSRKRYKFKLKITKRQTQKDPVRYKTETPAFNFEENKVTVQKINITIQKKNNLSKAKRTSKNSNKKLNLTGNISFKQGQGKAEKIPFTSNVKSLKNNLKSLQKVQNVKPERIDMQTSRIQQQVTPMNRLTAKICKTDYDTKSKFNNTNKVSRNRNLATTIRDNRSFGAYQPNKSLKSKTGRNNISSLLNQTLNGNVGNKNNSIQNKQDLFLDLQKKLFTQANFQQKNNKQLEKHSLSTNCLVEKKSKDIICRAKAHKEAFKAKKKNKENKQNQSFNKNKKKQNLKVEQRKTLQIYSTKNLAQNASFGQMTFFLKKNADNANQKSQKLSLAKSNKSNSNLKTHY